MNPLLAIVSILLVGISAAHLVRLIFQVEMTVGGFVVPFWVSIIGFIIPLALALLLWRKIKEEFIKAHLSPMKTIKKEKG